MRGKFDYSKKNIAEEKWTWGEINDQSPSHNHSDVSHHGASGPSVSAQSIGPCIINALTRFINSCLGATKLMVVRSQYKQIPHRIKDLTQDTTQAGESEG